METEIRFILIELDFESPVYLWNSGNGRDNTGSEVFFNNPHSVLAKIIRHLSYVGLRGTILLAILLRGDNRTLTPWNPLPIRKIRQFGGIRPTPDNDIKVDLIIRLTRAEYF